MIGCNAVKINPKACKNSEGFTSSETLTVFTCFRIYFQSIIQVLHFLNHINYF